MMLAIIVGIITLAIIGLFVFLAYCDLKTQKMDKQAKEDTNPKK